HERSPIVRMLIAGIGPTNFLLRLGQGIRAAGRPQVPVKSDHQIAGGFVIHRPETGHHIVPPSSEECPSDADKFVSAGSLSEISPAKRCLASAERNQAGV